MTCCLKSVGGVGSPGPSLTTACGRTVSPRTALSPTILHNARVEYARYVAIGDSFTEGVGDPDPSRPNGLRGWADRVAEVLAASDPDFGYANLAIRGRKLPAILGEQLDRALELSPDLVTLAGGGNDVLRPRADIDGLAASLDEGVAKLTAIGAKVVLFTLPDTRSNQSFKVVRGRVALFNEFVREIADTHDTALVDVWRNHDFDRRVFLDPDRLHLSTFGHMTIAAEVLGALGLEAELPLVKPAVPPPLSRREQSAEHIEWLRTFLLPWVARRLTGKSSGDGIEPKRPTFAPVDYAS